jgi:hypothetical protein
VERALDPHAGGRYESEHRIVHADGRTLSITARGRAVGAASQPGRRRFFGTLMDTTVRVAAAEARRASEVHSVENHRGFGEMMATELDQFDHVTLRIVEPVPSERPRVASAKEGHQGLDFADYVAAIDAVPGDFDLVVVDGRAREACLAAAQSRLAPGGIVVFDNSRRRRYREAILASGMLEQRFSGLTPTLPYPEQTSVLRTP